MVAIILQSVQLDEHFPLPGSNLQNDIAPVLEAGVCLFFPFTGVVVQEGAGCFAGEFLFIVMIR